MTMFKKNGGFTLVELIVVIAILAILAGVAIPAYSGYITKAQDAAVVTELDAIATAAQAANSVEGAISKIVVSADGTTITVTSATGKFASTYNADFVLFYEATPDATTVGKFTVTGGIENWANSSYNTKGATWANGKWAVGIN